MSQTLTFTGELSVFVVNAKNSLERPVKMLEQRSKELVATNEKLRNEVDKLKKGDATVPESLKTKVKNVHVQYMSDVTFKLLSDHTDLAYKPKLDAGKYQSFYSTGKYTTFDLFTGSTPRFLIATESVISDDLDYILRIISFYAKGIFSSDGAIKTLFSVSELVSSKILTVIFHLVKNLFNVDKAFTWESINDHKSITTDTLVQELQSLSKDSATSKNGFEILITGISKFKNQK